MMSAWQGTIHGFFWRNPGATDRQAIAYIRRSMKECWRGYYAYFRALDGLVSAGKLVEVGKNSEGHSKWKVAA